jgi:hypothetical protein
MAKEAEGRGGFEQYRRDDVLKYVRSLLIIAVLISLAVWDARAEDVPSSNSQPHSERGPNYPSQQHGPAYPKTQSDPQQSGPSSGGGTASTQRVQPEAGPSPGGPIEPLQPGPLNQPQSGPSVQPQPGPLGPIQPQVGPLR